MSHEEVCEGLAKTTPRMLRVEELFLAALELPTAQRAAFLDRECRGDDKLRRELDELLVAERGPSLGFPEPSRIKLLPTRKLQPKGFATTERAEPGHGGNASSEEESRGPVLRAGNCIGQYELIRQLGRGGMGEVHLARDLRLGRLVALKLLAEHRPSLVERFLAEARTTALCHHENIVVIHEVGERQRHPFMVLEYLEGQTLRQWLREHASAATGTDQRAAVPPGRAVELMLPVVRALAYAHERGIVHRDLKPENIMLTRAGTIKVLDFGIAKLLAAPAPDDESTAGSPGPAPMHSSALIGTLPYMSPEQMNVGAIDHRSDLWAVGIMLFELVTGHHPVPSRSMGDLMRIAEEDTPMPSVRERMPDIGPLGAVIDRCLLKYPAHRTPDARVLLAELEALAPGRRSLAIGENGSPFAGLAAFQEVDADRFFGRDRDIEQIITELRSRPLVAVVGASGVGKSSLVRAGVIPALKRSGEGWDACVMRPGRSPLAALAGVLAHLSDIARTTSDGAPGPAQPTLVDSASHVILAPFIERLRTEPGYLGARLRARASSKLRRILVFVDQFEELYTLGVAADERSAFLACLAAVADDAASPLRVILSMRSDFLGRTTEDRHLSAEVTRGLLLLPAMGREGLREALLRPLESREFRFESPALVERMVDALDATSGALPLLQFTAARLWDLRDTGRRMLTEASYEQIGGVAGALASHADSVLASMPGQDARVARTLFLRLITPERTRDLVTLTELRRLVGDAGGISRVLTRLIDARLLAIGGSAGGAAGRRESDGLVEIVHESLIDTWPLLGQWLVESEEDAIFLARLRSAAKDWQRSGHATGLLWTGEAAREARVWYQRYQGELAAVEEQYLAAVFTSAERQRRLRRRLIGGALSATAVVAVVMAYLAWQQGKATSRATEAAEQAKQEAARAEQEAMRGRDATRMAVARSLPEDPTTQIALLREIEDTKSPPAGTAHELRRLLHADVARLVLTGDEPMTSVAFSPDGSRIVSSSVTGTKQVWDAGGAGVLHTFKDRGTSVAFSADGSRIFSLEGRGPGRIWNADGSGAAITVRGPYDNSVLALSADGSRVASDCYDSASTPCVWNTDGSGARLALSGGRGASPILGAFSHDGALLASACCNDGVHIWKLNSPGPPVILGRGDYSPFSSLDFSPDGSRIVVVNREGINVWNTDGSGAPLTVRGHKGEAYSAVFSPDGSRIASASADDTIHLWDAHDATIERILRGHTDEVRSVAFSLDGKRIASASDDMTIRVWNALDSRDSWALGHPGHPVTTFDLSPDGSRIIIASFEANEAQILNVDGSGAPIVLRGHSAGIQSVAFSPDGVYVASASADKTVRIWRADNPGAPTILRSNEHEVRRLSFSPDGSRVISASFHEIHIWNIDGSGEPIILRQSCRSEPIVSPDRTRIACLSHDRAVWVRNTDGSGEPLILRGRGPSEQIGVSLAFSPDGARIATIFERSSIGIWNADGSGEPIVLGDREAWAPVFSPDGSRIASASGKTIRIWNADGSGEPLVLSGHQDMVSRVAFSLDGSRIVSTSYSDGTMRVWRIDGSEEPLVIPAQAGSARFTPDGQRIVAMSEGKVWVWEDLTLPDLHDPRLWTITNYCMPIAVRQQLLGVSEESARRDRQRCLGRVEQARRAGMAGRGAE